MPLSEHEQRILADIEARLREDDPRFADAVGTKAVGQHLRRRLKLAMVGFVVGFVLLFVALQAHVLWGVLGFALMLTAAFHGVTVLKRLAGSAPADGASGPRPGVLQRYLDAARRRDDDAS